MLVENKILMTSVDLFLYSAIRFGLLQFDNRLMF